MDIRALSFTWLSHHTLIKIRKTASPFGGVPNGHSPVSLLIPYLFPVLRDCLHRPALMDPCSWVVKPLFISAAPVARRLQSNLWKLDMQSQLWLECVLKTLTRVESSCVCAYTSSQKVFQWRAKSISWNVLCHRLAVPFPFPPPGEEMLYLLPPSDFNTLPGPPSFETGPSHTSVLLGILTPVLYYNPRWKEEGGAAHSNLGCISSVNTSFGVAGRESKGTTKEVSISSEPKKACLYTP